MARSEEKIKYLAAVLDKDNPVLIKEAVEMLRDEEPFEGAVGLLASCYDRNPGVMVCRAIESFLNDLKEKSLRAEVIGEIRQKHKPWTTAMLVSSCWQSGLDYSAFSIDLAEIFIRSEYGIALECFTVIEEAVPSLTSSEKKAITILLSDYSLNETGAKKALANELISRLDSD